MTGWRYACPHGHRQVHRVGGESVHSTGVERSWVCDSCRANADIETCHYGSVTDLKTGAEVPV